MNPEDMISQYFRLTGRPISTMSVTEYLQFLSAAEISHGTYESRHTEAVIATGTLQAEPYHEDIPDKKSIYDLPEPITEEKSVTMQPVRKKSSEETKLALLKSVSG